MCLFYKMFTQRGKIEVDGHYFIKIEIINSGYLS